MTNDNRNDGQFNAMEEQNQNLTRDLRALAHHGRRDERFHHNLRDRLLVQAQTVASTHLEGDESVVSAASTMAGPRRARVHDIAAPWRQFRFVLVAVLVLVGSVALAYLRPQVVAPVSAQSVLRQAVAAIAAVPPNQVVHETSRYEGFDVGAFNGQPSRLAPFITIDQWTQRAATGVISRQATTGALPDGKIVFREIQMGRNAQLYREAANRVQVGGIPKGQSASWVDNPMGITDLSAFLRAVKQGLLPNIRLLPRTTLSGVSVDVIESRGVEQLPRNAPTGIKPAQDIFDLYLDANDHIVRGLDQIFIDGHGKTHVYTRLRVTQRHVLPVAAVPVGTFALHAPSSAKVIIRSRLATVAESASRPDRPAPLLEGDPLGLQLQYISVDKLQGYDRFIYQYRAGTPTLGQYDLRKGVDIELFHYTPPSAHATMAPSIPVMLRIAGATVHARYGSVFTDNAGLSHSLYYHQGMTSVSIGGSDMTKKQFFAVVDAFVDGHTHPAVVSKLQAEIDAP